MCIQWKFCLPTPHINEYSQYCDYQNMMIKMTILNMCHVSDTFPLSILSHFTIRKQRLRGLKYLAYSHRAGEKVEVDFDYSSVHIPEQLCPYSRTHVLEPAPTGFWEPSIDYTSQSCHWQLFGGTWNWTWQGYLNHENWQIHQIKTPPPHQSQMTI